MSSFYCEKCGKAILDSPNGYTTGCEHYPLEKFKKKYKYPKIEEIRIVSIKV